MKFEKADIFAKALKAASEWKEGGRMKFPPLFIDDVIAKLPCGKTTFYALIGDGSNELNEIKSIIEQNRIEVKEQIRAKLFKNGKAADLLALYRMIATTEERKAINQNYLDVTTDGNAVTISQEEKDRYKELFG